MTRPSPITRCGSPRCRAAGCRKRRLALLLATGIFAATQGSIVCAQHAPQAAVTVPLHQTARSFYEQIGVNWGFHVGNFFFEQNGGAAVPPFGGFAPGGGLQTGFQIHGPGGFDGHFNIAAGQGAQTSLTSQSITTTMPNGVPGFFSDSSQTPFVVGVVPVVGDAGTSPLEERLDRLREGGAAAYGPRGGSHRSAAAQPPAVDAASAPAATLAGGGQPTGQASTAAQPPAGSVAQLAAMHAAAARAQQREIERLVAKAQEAEAAGKLGQARIFYRQAANRAATPLKERLLDRAARLPSTSAQPTRTSGK